MFKYRIHDSRLGRFLSVDPLAPEYPFYSPYHFAGNSPVTFKDREGAEPKHYLHDWKFTKGYHESGDSDFFGHGSVVKPRLRKVEGYWVYSRLEDHTFDASQKYWYLNETTSKWEEFSPNQEPMHLMNEAADNYGGIMIATVGLPVVVIGGIEIVSVVGVREVIDTGVDALAEANGITLPPISLTDVAELTVKKSLKELVVLGSKVSDLRAVQVTTEGIEGVRKHLSNPRFLEKGKMAKNNEVMLERLEKISKGEIEPTMTDKKFYTHELREKYLMENKGLDYDSAHAKSMDDYGLKGKDGSQEFYTPEANQAWYDQLLNGD